MAMGAAAGGVVAVSSCSQVVGTSRFFCRRLGFGSLGRPSHRGAFVAFGSLGDSGEDAKDELLRNAPLVSTDDASYLWKLAAGSVGGASVIKYGSIVFPEATQPNIWQALLMVSLPVAVAVLILLKESYLGSSTNED